MSREYQRNQQCEFSQYLRPESCEVPPTMYVITKTLCDSSQLSVRPSCFEKLKRNFSI